MACLNTVALFSQYGGTLSFLNTAALNTLALFSATGSC